MRSAFWFAALGAACTSAPQPVTPSTPTAATPAVSPMRPASLPLPASGAPDSASAGLVPVGFGTLRQDDIAISLQANNVLVKLIPLDESVIRVLAPDSYRSLHNLYESRRESIGRSAAMHGLKQGHVWQAEFIGLAPDARFVPGDVTVTSAGREFRPVDMFPLTTGFGQQRLQPQDRQRALYLFDDAVDVTQPLTVTMGSERNTDWQAILVHIAVTGKAITPH